MVQFDANPEKFDSVKMLSKLEDNVNSCISLNNQISQMEEEIILSPTYIKKSSSGVGGSSIAPATPGGARPSVSELDDDISLGGVGLGGTGGSVSASSHHRSTAANSTMNSSSMPSSSSAISNSVGAMSNHVNTASGVGSTASSSSNTVTQSSNMNGPA